MRPVFKGSPIPTPFDRDFKLSCRLFHPFGKLVVERPVPRELAVEKHRQVNGVAVKVAGLHCLGRPSLYKLLLAFQGTEAFRDHEINIRDLGCTFDDFDKVWVDALESL